MKAYRRIKLATMDPGQAAREIGDFIVERTLSCGFNGGVIGLSGGVDSTTTAAVTQLAYNAYNKANHENALELVGYILPSKTNDAKDTEDGVKVAKRLGIKYEIRNIESVVNAYQATNPDTFNSKYHKGNLTAEVRATILHQKSATEHKILLGTGNRDEDYGVAYYTLFGDGAVHCSPIGMLPKRLVRQMAAYLGFKDLANRTPTAGLEPGQTDFKDLGYEYEFVELVSEGITQEFSTDELIMHPQVCEMAYSQLKKYEDTFGSSKFSSVEDMVADIVRRNNIAKAKADIVHPPIAPVTLIYR